VQYVRLLILRGNFTLNINVIYVGVTVGRSKCL